MPKEIEPAFDAIGQEIFQNSVVAAPLSTSSLLIGMIEKISPKMVTIRGITAGRKYTVKKYHKEIVVISDSPAASMFVLTHV